MELFDLVKAAPPPQTIGVPERKTTPSPIPPDSPDAIDAADDDGLLESLKINDEENEDELREDNNKKMEGADKVEDADDEDASPFKIPTTSQISSPLPKEQEETSSSSKIQKKLKKYKQPEEDMVTDAKEEELEKSEKPEKQEDGDDHISKPLKTPETASSQSDALKSAKTLRKCKDPEKLEASEEEPQHAKPHKKRAREELEDNGDSDVSSDGYPKSMPTKTKAQQKMFSDLPDKTPPPSHIRECFVRIRRLTQSEIDAASASLSNSPFADRSPLTAKRKRGRPRKTSYVHRSPSPASKLKTSPTSKIHIKVPQPYGGKKRGQQHLARPHTPPPKWSMLKARSNSRKLPKRPTISPALIQRYGARIFNCVVRIKRTPWPSKSPERNPRPGLGGVRKGRPRKSNLSVSFSEAVEILGSNEGGSRRSTFGTISSKSPKPTRLQRVDATGNVLEDIALTSSPLLSGNAAASSSGESGSRGKSKRRSCNGSPRLKRPHQRIPLSGLASLRLDDGPKSDHEDEEYIVPNELPGTKRPGTPTPNKKKISFTTTVSDDEDERPAPKKFKDANAPKKRGRKPKPKVAEKSSLKESILQKGKLQDKSNEIAKETLKKAVVVLVKDQVREIEVSKAAAKQSKVVETENKEERDSEEPENPMPVDVAEADPQDSGETSAKTEKDAGQNVDASVEENATENAEEKVTDNAEEKAIENAEEKATENAEEKATENAEEKATENAEEKATENAEEKSEANVEQSGVDVNESTEVSALEATQTEPEEVSQRRDDEREQEKAKNIDDFRELDTPTSQPLPPMTEENQDDVLEIQTSLEDVRQLHTPILSQESTTQASKRIRLDSGDSDCSFKSASEQNKDVIERVNAGEDKAVGEEAVGEEAVREEAVREEAVGEVADAAPGEDKSTETLLPVSDIDSAAMPAVLITPPSVPRTVNGSEPINGGSGITAACYSPIEAMPTLDDEVLEQLVEPDFQLNSSRHAISRGTLDDIMTALES